MPARLAPSKGPWVLSMKPREEDCSWQADLHRESVCRRFVKLEEHVRVLCRSLGVN